MAIRLRHLAERGWVALCAARSVEQPGDVYLDDDQHNALANKFARDFSDLCDQPLPGVYDDSAIVEREEDNNPNRAWWDEEYGRDGRGGRAVLEWNAFLAAAEWQPVIEGQLS